MQTNLITSELKKHLLNQRQLKDQESKVEIELINMNALNHYGEGQQQAHQKGSHLEELTKLNKNQILMKAVQKFIKDNKGEEEKPVKECIKMFNNFRIRPSSPLKKSSSEMNSKNSRSIQRESISPAKQMKYYQGAKDEINLKLRSTKQESEINDNFLDGIKEFSPSLVLKLDDPLISEAVNNLGLTNQQMQNWVKLSDFYSIQESTRMQIRRYLTALNEIFYKIEAIIKERDRLISMRNKQKKDIIKNKQIDKYEGGDSELNRSNDRSADRLIANKVQDRTIIRGEDKGSNSILNCKDNQADNFEKEQDERQRKDRDQKKESLKQGLKDKLKVKMLVEERLTWLRGREAVEYEEKQAKQENLEKQRQEKVLSLMKKQKDKERQRIQEKKESEEERRQELAEFKKIEEQKRIEEANIKSKEQEKFHEKAQENLIEQNKQTFLREKKAQLWRHRLEQNKRDIEDANKDVTQEHYQRLEKSIQDKNSKHLAFLACKVINTQSRIGESRKKGITSYNNEEKITEGVYEQIMTQEEKDESKRQEKKQQEAINLLGKKYEQIEKAQQKLKWEQQMKTEQTQRELQEKQEEYFLRLKELEIKMEQIKQGRGKQLEERMNSCDSNRRNRLADMQESISQKMKNKQTVQKINNAALSQQQFIKATQILNNHNRDKRIIDDEDEIYEQYLQKNQEIRLKQSRERIEIMSSPKLAQLAVQNTQRYQVNHIFNWNDHSF